MFDNLGTFTTTQLRERHAFLKAQRYAIPAQIEHLTKRAERLVGFVTDEDPESFPVTYERDGVVYSLTTESIPKVAVIDSYTTTLLTVAGNSRFPMRADPITNDVTLGDHVWRFYAKLAQVDEVSVEGFRGDDTFPADRSTRVLKPFRKMFKRPESLEEKSKKAKYQFMLIKDEIDELTKALDIILSEIEVLESMLSNTVEFTNTAGEPDTGSEYPSAGVEQKDPDVLAEVDIELLRALSYPPSTGDASSEEAADQPADTITPVPFGVETTGFAPTTFDDLGDPEFLIAGDINDFKETFPRVANKQPTSKGYIESDKIQILANIWTYLLNDFDRLSNTDSLFMGSFDADYNYMPPNVLLGLQEWLRLVQLEYPTIGFRVTEAWPPTWDHQTFGHFTGNALDMVVLGTDQVRGFTTHELTDAILKIGLDADLFNKIMNHYDPKYMTAGKSTGAHLHVEWRGAKAIFVNDARILRLGLTEAQASTYRLL